MSKELDFGTTYGLALSSGINAYLPLLSYTIAARFFHLYKVNPTFSFVTQDWFMIALVILSLADLFADKIPVLDHLWDAIHTVLRPIAGALVASVSNQHPSAITMPVSLIAGGTLAAMVHTTKAATRVASTATTAGCLNVFISIGEDIFAVTGILLSLFAPVVMIVVLVVFIGLFLLLAPRIIRRFNRWRHERTMRRANTRYIY